jgi:RNA polymerase sigma factor (sigma-70 family)
LLRRFAQTNSEDAFAEIVRRHVNLVYSAALRQVNGDGHLAKDISQTVFTDLARKANSLSRHENLSGWLYTSAHFAAAKIVRTENRRRDREEKFMRELTNKSSTGVSPVAAPNAEHETDWQKIRPALDDAMHELKETDRDAILSRYFENQQFAEVGAKLGLSENAARMRVERALEKLRTIFAKRGITTATAFASVISANAIQIAPANLAATLTTTSIAAAGTGTFTFLKIMTATKIKLAFSAIVVAGAATAFVIQQQTQNKLRDENGLLQQQVSQLQSDNENFSNRLANVGDSKKLSDEQFNELLKLRGEVGMLQQQTVESKKAQEEINEANQKAQAAEEKLATTLSVQAKFAKQETATINAMKYLSLDMRIYAGDHDNQFPTNDDLYKLVNNYDGNTNLLRGIPAIEYVSVGVKLNSQDQPDYPNLVVIRERIAQQAPGGTWHRIYGFADGSVQTAISYDGNFDAWEKANTYSPPPNPNQ